MRRLAPVEDRWELGSDFHLTGETGGAGFPWDTGPHSYWGCGRDAIRALFEWGREQHGWRTLLMPSYFCQDVVASTLRTAPVQVYPMGPVSGATVVPGRSGDVVLIPAFFGAPPRVRVEGPAMTIEDHSHDLLASSVLESQADFAVASLRKTLPLPDGGVVWSPRDRKVPPEQPITGQHASSALLRLSAMILKRDYLRGEAVAKPAFRELSVAGEMTLASGPPSGMSAFSRERLHTLPLQEWRSQRARNHAALRSRLLTIEGIEVLDFPFAVMLLFDDPALRDRVRGRLIDAAVYPSALWPLDDPAVEGLPREDIALSRRILSIACDQRYTIDDMRRVAMAVRQAIADPGGLEPAGSLAQRSGD